MKKSISKVLGLRQLSSVTLRSRSKGGIWCVMAVMQDGVNRYVGSIVSSRLPSTVRIRALFSDWSEFGVSSVARLTVFRKDVYKFAADYVVEFPNE